MTLSYPFIRLLQALHLWRLEVPGIPALDDHSESNPEPDADTADVHDKRNISWGYFLPPC